MTNEKTDEKNKTRVVLNLSIEQAKETKLILENPALKDSPIAMNLLARITKTINNHEAKAMGYARGTKQMLEEESKVIAEIAQESMKLNTEAK